MEAIDQKSHEILNRGEHLVSNYPLPQNCYEEQPSSFALGFYLRIFLGYILKSVCWAFCCKPQKRDDD
ncbi:hypothetical protein CapIbe_023128 [Capra ibex]